MQYYYICSFYVKSFFVGNRKQTYDRERELSRGSHANYRFAYFSHFTISGSVGRLPYIRMPIR